jgi:hypothetical protein
MEDMEEDVEPPAPAAWFQASADETPLANPAPVASFEEVPPAMPEAEGQPAATVSGRVLVTIAPVPDFDRLLNLDGALGRMSGIANVSLADYAKEEVTFRLEIEQPMSADDFARHLSASTGSQAEVSAAAEGKLALRLAS